MLTKKYKFRFELDASAAAEGILESLA